MASLRLRDCEGESWPHFLGPRYDGSSAETGILTDWSDGKLRLVWSRRLGTSYGIGSVAAGRYLQLARFGDEERLTCLNAETGGELWQRSQPVDYEDMYGYNNGPRTSPTIAGDAVYTLGVAGQLSCRGLADGELRWTLNVNERYGVVQNFFGVGASPLVWGDLVIVMVGGSPAEDADLPRGSLDLARPNGSGMVAFDRHTGAEVYRVGDNLASYSTPRPFRFNGQTWVLALMREGLLAFDAESGAEKFVFPWRAPQLESVNAAVPLVRDSQILISECYRIGSALLEVTGPETPRVLRSDKDNYRDPSFRAHWATPIRVGDYLYGCSGRNPGDSDFRCVAWTSGEPQWVEPLRERTSVMGVDGHLVVLTERGELSLVRPSPDAYRVVTSLDLASRDPAQPQRPRLRYPCWAAPILSHGLLYVRGESRLLCFELSPEGT